MPNYVIEREIPGAGQWTQEQIREISLRSLGVLQELGVQWMHSYVTDDKVYCIYWAPGEDVIRKHADRLGVPANRIAAVRRLMQGDVARESKLSTTVHQRLARRFRVRLSRRNSASVCGLFPSRPCRLDTSTTAAVC